MLDIQAMSPERRRQSGLLFIFYLSVSFIYDCQNNKCINTDQTICSVISDCITMIDERSTMFSSNELTYLIDKLCKE